ncbi:MAG: hypothetical protein AAGM67_18570, partial [Bacteroidota bacterium]
FSSLGTTMVWGYSKIVRNDEFVRQFGATPAVCCYLWRRMIPLLPTTSLPLHLLWTLFHAKNYPTDKQFRILTGHDPKTLSKHMRPIRHSFLSVLPQIVRNLKQYCWMSSNLPLLTIDYFG